MLQLNRPISNGLKIILIVNLSPLFTERPVFPVSKSQWLFPRNICTGTAKVFSRWTTAKAVESFLCAHKNTFYSVLYLWVHANSSEGRENCGNFLEIPRVFGSELLGRSFLHRMSLGRISQRVKMIRIILMCFFFVQDSFTKFDWIFLTTTGWRESVS